MLGFHFYNRGERSVRRRESEVEFQDVFLDNLAQKQGEQFQEQKLEVPLSRKILVSIYVAFLLLVLVFFSKVFEFQIISGKDYAALAEKNAIRKIPIFADRGIIYSSSFEKVAQNKPSFDFVCDKRDLPELREDKEKILSQASEILNRNYADVKKEFDEGSSPEMLLKENISHEEHVVLETKRFEGCQARENNRRDYPQEQLFAHILGYTSKISPKELEEKNGYFVTEQIGKTGLEAQYEEVLRGKTGSTLIERDSMGNVISKAGVVEPEAGKGIVLWLDAGLQKAAEAAVKNVFRDTGTKKAAVVAMDPRTGGVLALMSFPEFDNNLFSQGISQKDWQSLISNPAKPLFNRVTSGIGFPTGSVIKPLVALAALEEGIINGNTSIFSPLEICIRNKYTDQDECFRDWTFHGSSDVKRAIAESVNTFFYIIGGGYEDFKGLGATKIKQYLELFGWNRKTNVDLPGEGKGILPDIGDQWRLGDTYHFSIGQGAFTMTPMQVVRTFAAIANGGKLLVPQIVRKIVDGEKNVLKEFFPKKEAEGLVDETNLKVVREGMRRTVTNGSATAWLNGLPVSSAAKTGTAQTGRKTVDGKDYLYSWTVAFAPYDNPEIVLVVVVEDVIEGQVASLPVARDVFQWYFTRTK